MSQGLTRDRLIIAKTELLNAIADAVLFVKTDFTLGDDANLTFDGTDLGLGSSQRFRMQSQNRTRYLNSMVIAARTTAQTISNDTFTLVAFNATDILDTDNLHDTVTNNSRLTAAITGKYFIFAFLGFVGNATGVRSFRIEKNSAGTETIANAIIQQTLNAVIGDAQSGTSLAAFIELAAGDHVECFCYQNSTGNLDMNGATVTNKFGMAYLGE